MPSRPSARTLQLLGALIALATLLRLGFGLVFFGFHTGDDVEILQAGLMRALGWPYRPWEIRNLFVSDLLVAPAVWLASALGVGSTRTLLWAATFPFVVLASVNAVLVFRLARRWLGSDGTALAAAGLYAFHWLPLGYGSMVYPRTASTTCVLLAALLLSGSRDGRLRQALAGGLAGVAFAIRYSEAVFLLPMLAVLCLREGSWRQRAARCGALLGGFAVVAAVIVGLEDQLTWGRPFSSLAAFARYTLIEERSSSLQASQPWFWYLRRLHRWLPLTLLPLLWQARRVRGWSEVALWAALPLAALSAVHHKELRYLQGVLPFVILLAAAGLWSLWALGRRRLAVALCAASLLWGVRGTTFLARKSMAAVEAAEALATVPDLRAVALAQAWAYGTDLYLGPGVAVLDLPLRPAPADLERALATCRWVALYEEDVRASPAVAKLLAERGLVAAGQYRRGRSRPVVVYGPRERARLTDLRSR